MGKIFNTVHYHGIEKKFPGSLITKFEKVIERVVHFDELLMDFRVILKSSQKL